MVLILKKKSAKKDIEAIEKKLWNNVQTGFNAQKYCGVVSLKASPMDIQKQLRDGWERDFS